MNQDSTAIPPNDPDAGAKHTPEIDTDKLDPDALKVLYRLEQFGHEAYLVGGCVRDLLLKRKPKDFDLCTSAHPEDVRAIFRNCRLIGRRFRLAHVYFKGGKIIEVSTFRANPAELEDAPCESVEAEEGQTEQTSGEGTDGDLLIRHDNVFGTAEEDARRRDFTINGLFYDVVAGQVIDYVRGRRDLDERFIRTIGDPERRMREDPVRILRAVRFACKLGFDIESRTYAAMEAAVEDLPRCSAPRLLEETFRLIRGGVAAPSLKLLSALDALKLLLPPIDRYLKEGGSGAERLFFSVAQALDKKVLESEEPFDDAVLLAALLLPLALQGPEPRESEQETVAGDVEALLRDLVQAARLPRRIAEKCRSILVAQRILSGERKRRRPLITFRRHPSFNDALLAFSIWVEASGLHRQALEAWLSGSAPESPSSADVPKRRRRRRRRPSSRSKVAQPRHSN